MTSARARGAVIASRSSARARLRAVSSASTSARAGEGSDGLGKRTEPRIATAVVDRSIDHRGQPADGRAERVERPGGRRATFGELETCLEGGGAAVARGAPEAFVDAAAREPDGLLDRERLGCALGGRRVRIGARRYAWTTAAMAVSPAAGGPSSDPARACRATARFTRSSEAGAPEAMRASASSHEGSANSRPLAR